MPKLRRVIPRLLSLAATITLSLPSMTAASEPVFPGENWQTRPPAELGLDPARLDAVAEALGGRGAIVKDGYLVKAWGSQTEVSDWYSSAKPVLSTLLLFAVQEGKVSSVDARLVEFGWALRDKDRPMTLRHLGAMTSGYARPEPPGAAWSYNDYAIQLYQKTLFDRVFKDEPERVVAAPERFGALGFEDGLQFRKKNRRISASVRDFARIAWLWCNRGRWGKGQLIRRELFEACCRPQVPADLPLTAKAKTDDYLAIGTYGGESDHFSQAGPGIYGFNWWFNAKHSRHRDELTWPDAPADTFMSLGLHGNCTAMFPSLRLVIATANGDWGQVEPGKSNSEMNQQLKQIAEAGNSDNEEEGSADDTDERR
jgi:CubicO group peptidase (beta-lactamase class C family)